MEDYVRFAKIVDDVYNKYVEENAEQAAAFNDLFKDFGAVAGASEIYIRYHRLASLIKLNAKTEELISVSNDLLMTTVLTLVELQKLKEKQKEQTKKKVDKQQEK